MTNTTQTLSSSGVLTLTRDGTHVFDHEADIASGRLRAERYLQLGWISRRDVDAAGMERDRFDDSSTHYAVVDRRPNGEAVATGTVRIIRSVGGRLPVFEVFPALAHRYEDAVEVSRYIAMDPSASAAIRAAIIAHLASHEVDGVALMSPALRSLLGRQGLATHEIGPPTVVPRYGKRPQIAVAIDSAATLRSAEIRRLIDATDAGRITRPMVSADV